MNSRGNQNQPSSIAPRRTARKSAGTSLTTSVANNATPASSQTASPGTARKRTGTPTTLPANNNNVTSTSGTASLNSPRTARKSIGPSVPFNSTQPNSPTDTSNSSKPTPKKTRKLNAQRQIFSSNTPSKPSTQSSNLNSTPDTSQSLPSTSSNVSQSVPTKRATRSKNLNSSAPDSSQPVSSMPSNISQPGPSGEVSVGSVENLVNKCVSYILIADQKKYSIKKQDIIKHVFDHSDSKLYKTVIDKACQILKKTFGLEILEIENKKNEYLLINIMVRDLGTRSFAEYSTSELQKQGLVFYLLTLIYMNENVIGEDQLWKALQPLGINVNSHVPHSIFGDVRKYITVELVRQMYLEYRCISKDPIQYEFAWGQRAKQEVGKEELLEFACKVMGDDTQPRDWIYQYKDAMSQVTDDE